MKKLSALILFVAVGCNHSSSSLPIPQGNGDGGGGPLFDPCVSDPATGFDPKAHGLATCCPLYGGAHCVPSSDVIPNLAAQLTACTGSGAPSVCMPDPIIEAGGTYLPKPCTSSVGNAMGVCLSQCIPLVANNPQTAVLGQDGCGDGELCIPCLNPLSGVPTGACNLVSLLCSPGDGGVSDGGNSDGGGMTCPYKGPPLINPTTLPACAPACGGAHCLPASVVPAGEQSLLTACTAAGGAAGFCAPDVLIASGGNYVPPTCTSVAGAEGRCLSTCLPSIASEAALLPQDTCPDGDKCAPCYNPTAMDPTAPTGACSLACDKPSQKPVVLTCPWKGAPLADPTTFPDCAPACAGSHCIPSSNVPAAEQSLLAACPGGFCAPDPFITTGGNLVPTTCTSIAGAEGRCLSTCLPPIAAEASLLPKDVCADGEKCAPCFNPTAMDPTAATGACSLGCDKPASPPTVITCPWTGTPILDPTTLPDCAPTCGGAHCVPAANVPTTEQSLLAACPGGFCTPDPLIASAGNYIPPTCTSVAGAEGRCLSTCLPIIADQAADAAARQVRRRRKMRALFQPHRRGPQRTDGRVHHRLRQTGAAADHAELPVERSQRRRSVELSRLRPRLRRRALHPRRQRSRR